jgi:hypothetical protein
MSSSTDADAFTSPAERRRFVRIACPPDASVRLRAGTSARLLDLGLGGALVESSSRLTPGAVNATMFVSPEIAFRARAHIVRAFVAGITRDDSGGTSLVYRAGLEFGPMSSSEAGTLGTFVSAALHLAASATPILPERKVSIRFPFGWAISRKQGALVARSPKAPCFIVLGAPDNCSEQDLGETARASMLRAGFSSLHGQAAEINGLQAWVAFYTGRLHDMGVVIVEAAHVVESGRVYVVAGVAPLSAYEASKHEFFSTINSFGSDPGVAGVELLSAPTSQNSDGFDLASVPALSVA